MKLVKNRRFFVLAFGLLFAFMIGATRMQSYVNQFVPKTSGQTGLLSFHLDRTYLRKFTTGLSKYWVDGKVKAAKRITLFWQQGLAIQTIKSNI